MKHARHYIEQFNEVEDGEYEFQLLETFGCGHGGQN